MAGGDEEERGLQLLLLNGRSTRYYFFCCSTDGRKEVWYSRENFDSIIPTRKFLEMEWMCYCYYSNSLILCVND